jgi:hypothetical protein
LLLWQKPSTTLHCSCHTRHCSCHIRMSRK